MPRPRVWHTAWLLSCCAGAPPAWAAAAQGYALTLTPLLHHGTQWLIASADERSEPNTATQDRGLLPSMLRERHWWVLFDRRGHAVCTLPRRDGSQRSALAARTALQRGCAHAPAVLRSAQAWTALGAGADPGSTMTWSAQRVCVEARCTATPSKQRTVFNTPGQEIVDAAPAAARCVAARWLLVNNLQPQDGSGGDRGAAFARLPAPAPTHIVGYEFVRVDGVTVRPAALRCP